MFVDGSFWEEGYSLDSGLVVSSGPFFETHISYLGHEFLATTYGLAKFPEVLSHYELFRSQFTNLPLMTIDWQFDQFPDEPFGCYELLPSLARKFIHDATTRHCFSEKNLPSLVVEEYHDVY